MYKTNYFLPFHGQWLTFWGGDTAEQNHHHGNILQNYAFDFIQVDENDKWFRTDGKTLEDYYSFGLDVFAPADGEIIEVVDGVRDNTPGTINPYSIPGNYILIKHCDSEYSLLAHFRRGSILVKNGQKVKAGEKLGECGNSGNTSAPHIHFHVQDSDVIQSLDENYNQQDVAKSVKIKFSNLVLMKDDGEENKQVYSPIKGDVVKPSES